MPKIQRRTLVVGLGGTGCHCISYLKKALQNINILPTDEDIKAGGPAEGKAFRKIERTPIGLVAFDLDSSMGSNDTRSASIEDEMVPLNQKGLKKAIQNFDKKVDGYEAWYPDTELEIINVQEVVKGAGQWRCLGRMSYCLDQKKIENRINAEITRLMAMSREEYGFDTDDLDIYLVASTGGGTGSGLIIDTAHFLQYPNLRGDSSEHRNTNAFLLLPEIFKNVELGKRTGANTYALLKELRGFFSHIHDFRMEYPVTHETRHFQKGKTVPFSNLYLFGSQAGGTFLSTAEQCYGNMANVILTRATSPLSEKIQSAMTNKDQGEKNSNKHIERKKGGHIFATCSCAVLEFPEPERISRVMAEKVASLEHAANGGNGRYVKLITNLEERFREAMTPISVEKLSDIWQNEGEILLNLLAETKKSLKEINKIKPREFLISSNKLLDFIARQQDEFDKKRQEAVEKARQNIRNLLKFKNLFDGSFSKMPNIGQLHALTVETERILASWMDTESETTSVGLSRSHRETLLNLQQFLESKIKETRSVDYSFLGLSFIRYSSLNTRLYGPLFTGPMLARVLEDVSNRLQEVEKTFSVSPAAERDVGVFDLDGTARDKLAEELVGDRATLRHNRKEIEKYLDAMRESIGNWRKEELTKTNISQVGINRLYVKDDAILSDSLLKCIKIEAESLFHVISKEVFYSNDIEKMQTPPVNSQWSLLSGLGSVKQHRFDGICNQYCSDLAQRIKDGEIFFSAMDYMNNFRKIIEQSSQNCFTGQRGVDYVAWSLPENREKKYPYLNKNDFSVLKNRISNALDKVFPQATVASTMEVDESRVVIIFESHNNPVEAIMNIEEHRYNYHHVFPHPLKMLHVHKDYGRIFSGLFMEDIKKIYCGNFGCEYNIQHIDDKVQVCPSCREIIISRCGNNCGATTLEMISNRTDGSLPTNPCKHCGQPIQTFCWNCEKHGPQHVLLNETFCPHCYSEFMNKEIDYDEISTRGRLITSPAFCIHCQDLGSDNPYELPRELAHLYHGVLPGDIQVLKKGLTKHSIRNNSCPECAAKLFPECPFGDGVKIHYTQLDKNGRVACFMHNAHNGKVADVYECYHCRYPVTEDTKRCPRCLKKLVKCNQCSSTNKYMFTNDDLIEDQRCPECMRYISDTYSEMKRHIDSRKTHVNPAN